jgi:hypothetical protein
MSTPTPCSPARECAGRDWCMTNHTFCIVLALLLPACSSERCLAPLLACDSAASSAAATFIRLRARVVSQSHSHLRRRCYRRRLRRRRCRCRRLRRLRRLCCRRLRRLRRLCCRRRRRLALGLPSLCTLVPLAHQCGPLPLHAPARLPATRDLLDGGGAPPLSPARGIPEFRDKNSRCCTGKVPVKTRSGGVGGGRGLRACAHLIQIQKLL